MNIEKVIEELKKVNPEWDGAYRYYADTKRLDLEDTNISDITPLKGMPLKWLDLDNTNVSDLTPLKGMSLEGLDLDNTKVSDLTPLKGMPLKWLYLDNTKVSDLSPLKGMPLAGLDLKNTPAAEKPLPEWLDDNYIDVIEGVNKEDDILYISEILYREGKKGVGWCYKDFNKLIIDKKNIKKYMDMVYFEAFLNTGNHFFNKVKYMQVIENNKEDVSLSINDAIYFSYLWLLSGNRMKVVPDLYYIHRATKDSWWAIHSKKCIYSASEITRRIKTW